MKFHTVLLMVVLSVGLIACDQLPELVPATSVPTAIPTSAVALQQVATIPTVEAGAETNTLEDTAATDRGEVEPIPPANPTSTTVDEGVVAVETAADDAYPVEVADAPEPVEPAETVSDETYPAPAAAPIEDDAYPVEDAVDSAEIKPTPTPILPENTPVPADAYPSTTPSPPADPTPTLIPTPQPKTVNPLFSGLTFKDAAGLWRVDQNGGVLQLMKAPDGIDWPNVTVMTSPTADEIVLTAANDLWKQQPQTKLLQRLLNSPVRNECCYLQWLGEGTWLYGVSAGNANGSTPTLFEQNGERTTFYSQVAGQILAKAEGDFLAFDEGGSPRILRLSDGALLHENILIGTALGVGWQAGGGQAAWLAQSPDGNQALHIYTLADSATTLLASFDSTPSADWVPTGPAWQPGGSWIATEVYEADSAEISLYLIDANTGEQRELGQGSNPHWRDDGQQLAWETANGITLLSLANGQQFAAGLSGTLIRWAP